MFTSNTGQLDESTFGSSNLLVAYVRYSSPNLRCVTALLMSFCLRSTLKVIQKERSFFDVCRDHFSILILR